MPHRAAENARTRHPVSPAPADSSTAFSHEIGFDSQVLPYTTANHRVVRLVTGRNAARADIMVFKKAASKSMMGKTNAKKARAEPDDTGDDPAVREDGAAARARAHCEHRRLPGRLRLHLHRTPCPVTRRTAAHAPRAIASPHRTRTAPVSRRPPDQKETTREEEPSRQRSRHEMAHHRGPGERDPGGDCTVRVLCV